jgi:hypothetical protein
MPRIARKLLLPKISIALACSLLVGGCAVDPRSGQPSFKETFNSDDPCANNARNAGAVGAAVLGAIIGHQFDKNAGKYIGAGLGALVGGMIGADMDRKKCELSKIAKKYALDMTIVDIKSDRVGPANGGSNAATQPGTDELLGFSVSLKDKESGGHFLTGSDELLPNAKAYFADIAAAYSYARQSANAKASASPEEKRALEALKNKRVLIVGHSDDTGNSRFNADLSERRAQNVAKLFRDAGIPEGQIYFQGAGETLPIADNRSVEGRATNRRVEIVDLPDDPGLKQYLGARKARTDFYRVIAVADQPPVSTITPSLAGAAPAIAAASGGATAGSVPKPANASKAGVQKERAVRNAAPTGGIAQAGAKPAAPSNVAAPVPFDFGGAPLAKAAKVDIGRIVAERSTFNIISTAQAADSPATLSCGEDRPRSANGVKSLRDSREISTAEYLPNLYNTSWADSVNGHLVALTHVAVLRDGGSPARKPELLVYKDYAQNAAPGRKPDFTTSPEVNTYQGEKALLYRVFVDGPVKCMDIVIPTGASIAQGSWLYYGAHGQTFMAKYNPRIAK